MVSHPGISAVQGWYLYYGFWSLFPWLQARFISCNDNLFLAGICPDSSTCGSPAPSLIPGSGKGGWIAFPSLLAGSQKNPDVPPKCSVTYPSFVHEKFPAGAAHGPPPWGQDFPGDSVGGQDWTGGQAPGGDPGHRARGLSPSSSSSLLPVPPVGGRVKEKLTPRTGSRMEGALV